MIEIKRPTEEVFKKYAVGKTFEYEGNTFQRTKDGAVWVIPPEVFDDYSKKV